MDTKIDGGAPVSKRNRSAVDGDTPSAKRKKKNPAANGPEETPTRSEETALATNLADETLVGQPNSAGASNGGEGLYYEGRFYPRRSKGSTVAASTAIEHFFVLRKDGDGPPILYF